MKCTKVLSFFSVETVVLFIDAAKNNTKMQYLSLWVTCGFFVALIFNFLNLIRVACL